MSSKYKFYVFDKNTLIYGFTYVREGDARRRVEKELAESNKYAWEYATEEEYDRLLRAVGKKLNAD